MEFAQKIFDLVRAGDAARLQPLLVQGHIDSARLLEHSADPELYNDHGQAPLTGATDKGDAAMVELLLEHGAHVEGAMPGTRTALMMAAMFNRCDVVDLLLTRGANPDARDGGGLSVLEAAHIMGAPDTPSQLMKARQQL